MTERSGWRRLALSMSMLGLLSVEASAGKYCGDPVEGGKAAAPTQEEALTAAQKWWSSRAGALGRGYENWNNAADQSMECTQDGKGQFHCRASGRPCLPEGTLPEHLPKIEM